MTVRDATGAIAYRPFNTADLKRDLMVVYGNRIVIDHDVDPVTIARAKSRHVVMRSRSMVGFR